VTKVDTKTVLSDPAQDLESALDAFGMGSDFQQEEKDIPLTLPVNQVEDNKHGVRIDQKNKKSVRKRKSKTKE